MRWYYIDPQNPQETRWRDETLRRIDAWWRAFQTKSQDLSRLFRRESEWNLPAWMHDNLQAIHPRLMWEFGPAVRQPGHRLVITPESVHSLRPIVRTLLERAPSPREWEFYPHRLPENVELTMQTVEARTGTNISAARVAAQANKLRKIDLTFGFPPELMRDADQARQAAFVAAETLLGEQVLDAWIGGIDVALVSQLSRGLDLARGQETVSAVIRSILDQLPAVPVLQQPDSNNWTSVQIKTGPRQDDYTGCDDLIIATTRLPVVLEALCRRMLFHSSSHSRCNEWYCYLKLDAAGVPSGDRVAHRAHFEDPLVEALQQSGAAAMWGSGSGIRYSYVFLAAIDVNRVVQLMRQVLAPRNAPVRTWLQFCDSELSHEWVGLYASTPPPPLPEVD